jgi:hypothetical protein
MEELPLAFLAGAGQTGLLLLVVVFFLRGLVVPRRALDDERADTREWREAFQKSEEARLIQAEQTKQLLVHAETANALLTSIVKRSES